MSKTIEGRVEKLELEGILDTFARVQVLPFSSISADGNDYSELLGPDAAVPVNCENVRRSTPSGSRLVSSFCTHM